MTSLSQKKNFEKKNKYLEELHSINNKYKKQVEDAKNERKEIIGPAKELQFRLKQISKLLNIPKALKTRKMNEFLRLFTTKLKELLYLCYDTYMDPEVKNRHDLSVYRQLVADFVEENEDLIRVFSDKEQYVQIFGSPRIQKTTETFDLCLKIKNVERVFERGSMSNCLPVFEITTVSEYLLVPYKYIMICPLARNYWNLEYRANSDNLIFQVGDRDSNFQYCLNMVDSAIDDVFDKIANFDPMLKNIIYSYCF